MKQAYIWGLHGGWWHALARHDPAVTIKEVVSEKLTAIARAKNPDAPDVVARIQDPSKKAGPGSGTTICGLVNVPLAKIGVDPEDDDPLCESCRLKTA